jgi:hypothetical protein
MLGVYTEYWAFSIRIVHFFLLLGVYTEYWAFSICNGHSFLMLGVYTEYWAFSGHSFYHYYTEYWAFYICIGHSFIAGRQIQCGFSFLVGSPFFFTFWANIEDSGLRFTSLCPCVLRLGRGYCRVEFQYAWDQRIA